ncbi:MAG: hypothetical protein WAV21_02575 [Minisyncoccia bacterium]
MRYRGTQDRKISTYFALLIVTIVGSLMTMLIVRTAHVLANEYDTQTMQALLSL